MLADPVRRFSTIPISPRFHLAKNLKNTSKWLNFGIYPLTPIPYGGPMVWGNP